MESQNHHLRQTWMLFEAKELRIKANCKHALPEMTINYCMHLYNKEANNADNVGYAMTARAEVEWRL